MMNLDLKTLQFLSDVKDTVIEKITIEMPLESLSDEIVSDLTEIVHENPGNTDLLFNIRTANNMNVRLHSKKSKISVRKDLINYIESHPEMTFQINK